MAGYGYNDPTAIAAINKQAAANNAKNSSYVTSKPTTQTGYGMSDPNAARKINTMALANNLASTSSGGYGQSNVAAANYINQLAKTTPARAVSGTTVKNPTWAPISGAASYQLPASYDWSKLGGQFGIPQVSAWSSPSGSSGGGGMSGVGAALGSALGGGGMGSMGGGMGSLGSMMGGMGGLGSMMGGGGGGGAAGGGAAPEPAKEPEKPLPQRYWAGGYTAEQQARMGDASSLSDEASLKAKYDAENVARFKGTQGYDDLKKDRVKNAQGLAESQGGQYDSEGNYYSSDLIGGLVKTENEKRAKADAKQYDTPAGAVPVAGNAGDYTPTAAASAAPGGAAPAAPKTPKSGMDSDWLNRLAGMASGWFGSR